MELITTSVLTLLALYVLYSEPFKLPTIIKKNKKLSYILIIGLYLYYHQSNVVEGSGEEWYESWWVKGPGIAFVVGICLFILYYILIDLFKALLAFISWFFTFFR